MEDRTGAPGRSFWKLFAPIRQDLDRLSWCFSNQPWMGAPADFREEDLMPFYERAASSIQLWRPGSLARYADRFAEEAIELWAVEPTRDDPARLATRCSDGSWREKVIQDHAVIWMIYTDSSCWEIYTRKTTLLDEVFEGLRGKPWVQVFRGCSERRDELFDAAGLLEVWRAMNWRRG